MDFTYEDARHDIINYLCDQPEDYFEERGTTLAATVANADLITVLASEHHKCVAAFGNERTWSCKDACDIAPGIGTVA